MLFKRKRVCSDQVIESAEVLAQLKYVSTRLEETADQLSKLVKELKEDAYAQGGHTT